MKKVIFVVLLLAVASLGLALPSPKSPKSPKVPNLPNSPTLPPTSSLPASFASPQALGDDLKISPSCATAIFTIVTSPEFAKCIPLQAVLPIIPVITDPNFLKNFKADPAGTFKKVEPSFVTFSKGFCPAPKCSDKGVQGAIKTLSDGCADDLKNNTLIQMLFAVTVFYSPLHDFACFKSSDSKLFCWDESLKTIFSLPKSPLNITGDPLLDSIAVADCKAVCTDCDKSIVNTFFNFIKGNDLALKLLAGVGVDQKAIDGMKLGVAVKCGINFEDGKIPNKF